MYNCVSSFFAKNHKIIPRGGVENPSNITMDIGDTQLTWEAGRCYLVDDPWMLEKAYRQRKIPEKWLENGRNDQRL